MGNVKLTFYVDETGNVPIAFGTIDDFPKKDLSTVIEKSTECICT